MKKRNKILLILFLIANILIIPAAWLKMLGQETGSTLLGILMIILLGTVVGIIINNFSVIKRMWS